MFKCNQCKFVHYCGGLSEERRSSCEEYEQSNQIPYSSRWVEMSYYQRGDARNTPSMRDRLRNGE